MASGFTCWGRRGRMGRTNGAVLWACAGFACAVGGLLNEGWRHGRGSDFWVAPRWWRQCLSPLRCGAGECPEEGV